MMVGFSAVALPAFSLDPDRPFRLSEEDKALFGMVLFRIFPLRLMKSLFLGAVHRMFDKSNDPRKAE